MAGEVLSHPTGRLRLKPGREILQAGSRNSRKPDGIHHLLSPDESDSRVPGQV